MIEYAWWTVIEFYFFRSELYIYRQMVKMKTHCYWIPERIETAFKSVFFHSLWYSGWKFIDSCIEIHGLKFPLLLHAGRTNAHTIYRCLVDFERKINKESVSKVVVAVYRLFLCMCVRVCGLNFSETYSKLDFNFHEKYTVKNWNMLGSGRVVQKIRPPHNNLIGYRFCSRTWINIQFVVYFAIKMSWNEMNLKFLSIGYFQIGFHYNAVVLWTATHLNKKARGQFWHVFSAQKRMPVYD